MSSETQDLLAPTGSAAHGRRAALRPLAAPVRRVIVLEDRAQVVREGGVELAAGPTRLVIEDVAPVVVDRSLVVRVTPAARVDDVRVARRWRWGPAEARPDQAALAAARADLERRSEDAGLELQLLEEERTRRQRVVELLQAQLDRTLPWAEAWDPRWADELEAALAAVRALDDRRRAALAAAAALNEELARLLAPGGAAPRGPATLRADLVVELTAATAGLHRVSVQYVVPGAAWRPAHRATLRGGTLRFEVEAAVWQATGEDWTDVELACSTARPTDQAEPPVLEDDRLRARRRQDKQVQVAVREQAIATTGEGQAKAADEVPGVDDGGETRLLPAPVAATIAADGRLRRVPLAAFEVPADVDRIARPERSALVHLRSRQDNPGPGPLLAGPVDLIRESGAVGRGEVAYVAPGERFALGWGSDDALRVRREVREEREVARLTGKQTITRTVTLFVSNLDPLPARFRLEERVPVSEVEQVTIAVDPKATQPAAAPDQDGIVAWDLAVPARGTRTVTLVYRLTASSKVAGL